MKLILPITLLMIIMVVACQESTPEAPPVVLETPQVIPEPISIPDILNGVQVGQLLFGGQPSDEALKVLAENGYKTVLSVRSASEQVEDEQEKVETLGMTFVRIPMDKPVEEITDAQINLFATFMDQAEQPAVVHCGSGNRIAGLWAVWLVEHQRVDKERALILAEKAGMTDIRPVVEKRLADAK